MRQTLGISAVLRFRSKSRDQERKRVNPMKFPPEVDKVIQETGLDQSFDFADTMLYVLGEFIETRGKTREFAQYLKEWMKNKADTPSRG